MLSVQLQSRFSLEQVKHDSQVAGALAYMLCPVQLQAVAFGEAAVLAVTAYFQFSDPSVGACQYPELLGRGKMASPNLACAG